MKSFILFIVFSLLSFTDLKLIREFEITKENFEVDHLGNLYSWDSSGLDLIGSGGEILKSFGEVNKGELTAIDVSNPLKIIAFYEYSGEVYILDNNLNLHTDAIDLLNLTDRNINIVAYSNNSHFWLYDLFGNEIIRVDQNLKTVNTTGYLNSFLDQEFVPGKIIEKNEKLYVLSKNKGIAVFDIFGSFIKLIPFQGVSDFQISGDFILYQKEESLFVYSQSNHDQTEINFSKDKPSVVKSANGKFYVLSSSLIRVYEELTKE